MEWTTQHDSDVIQSNSTMLSHSVVFFFFWNWAVSELKKRSILGFGRVAVELASLCRRLLASWQHFCFCFLILVSQKHPSRASLCRMKCVRNFSKGVREFVLQKIGEVFFFKALLFFCFFKIVCFDFTLNYWMFCLLLSFDSFYTCFLIHSCFWFFFFLILFGIVMTLVTAKLLIVCLFTTFS